VNKERIAEAEFIALEQKIEKILEMIEKLKQENQKLQEEVNHLNSEKKSVVERINLMLDKIDEIL